MKIDKIIREEILGLKKEGLADKYAEKAFGIPDDTEIQNRRAVQGIKSQDNSINGTFINTIDDIETKVNVYKNPISLQNFGKNVRAISDENGDLYIAQFDGDFIHDAIVDALNQTGRYNIQSLYENEDWIQWYRFGATNKFGYAGSYYDLKLERPDIADRLVEVVKKKHPKFEFYPIYWRRLKE